jgi:NAD(P)-dependent dehydrogenase (short-subunit alcohol dehydrogenase family)
MTTAEPSSRPVAVITGGGRGIGRGITVALVAAGFDVVVGFQKGAAAADATAAEVTAGGGEAVTVQGDVVDPLTSTRLAEAALNAFGRLDCWVNNAGILNAGPILDLTLAEVTQSFEVNYLGSFHGLQAAARTMVAAGRGGRIVNISSEAGLRAWPLYGSYTPTKFAQIGLTQVAALELGRHGILVNAVCPGLVETDMVLTKWPLEAALNGTTVEQIRADSEAMTPTGRLATPADVGATVAWLAGPGAASVTGQAICVNGGVTLH